MGDLGSRARSGPIAARSMKSLDGAARHRVCRIGEGEFYPYEEEMSASSDTYGTYKMSTRANAYYARNRWYDSAMGRFTTPDPYGGSAKLTNPRQLEPLRLRRQRSGEFQRSKRAFCSMPCGDKN